MFSCHWNHWGVHYCTPAQQRCRCVNSYLGRQRRNSLVKPSKRTPGKPGKPGNFPQKNASKISFSLDETLTKPIKIYNTPLQGNCEQGSRRQDPGISRLWFQHVWTEGWVNPCGSWIEDFQAHPLRWSNWFLNWAQLGPVKESWGYLHPQQMSWTFGQTKLLKVSWSFKLLRSCQNQHEPTHYP